MNRKSLLILAICLYVASAGTYAIFAQRKVSQWSQLRAERIAASPKVYITPEGKKYHDSRHYADRSKEISLYEAKEMGFDPCKICFRQRIASGVIMEHPVERQAEDIQIIPPLPWPVTHWITLLAVLTPLLMLTAVLLMRQLSQRI